jgi:hypothetical protein
MTTRTFFALSVLTLSAASPAFAAGPTAGEPSRSAIEIVSEAQQASSLTDRFNLPSLSGTLRGALPPVLGDGTPRVPPLR